MKIRPSSVRSNQIGGAIIEFSLVLIGFLALLFAIIEMGRALFTFNSAVEATRRGARLAVVTAPADFDTVVVPAMQKIMPGLTNENVTYARVPSGCTTDCEYVEVGIKDYTMTFFYWPENLVKLPGDAAHPGFKTTLPAESMGDN